MGVCGHKMRKNINIYQKLLVLKIRFRAVSDENLDICGEKQPPIEKKENISFFEIFQSLRRLQNVSKSEKLDPCIFHFNLRSKNPLNFEKTSKNLKSFFSIDDRFSM